MPTAHTILIESMAPSIGLNPIRSRLSNQVSILQIIYRHGPVLRSDIAAALGLSLPTITATINNMLEEGIIREVDESVSSSVKGRKAHPVEIVPDAFHFLGAEMRSGFHTLVITDFAGNRLIDRRFDASHLHSYEEHLIRICSQMNALLAEASMTWENIDGLGFAVPGIADNDHGRLQHPYSDAYGSRDLALTEDLRRLSGYTGPVTIDNNVCARAVSLQFFSPQLLYDCSSFLYLFIGTGVASPLVLRRENGSFEAVGPGEAGKMILQPSFSASGSDISQTAEELCSDQALMNAAKSLMKQGQLPRLSALCPDPEALTMEHLLEAQTLGDPMVCSMIENVIRYLGILLANLINFSNPQKLFVEGALFSLSANQNQLHQAISSHLYRILGEKISIHFLPACPVSGAAGGAGIAVRTALDTYKQ